MESPERGAGPQGAGGRPGAGKMRKEPPRKKKKDGVQDVLLKLEDLEPAAGAIGILILACKRVKYLEKTLMSLLHDGATLSWL